MDREKQQVLAKRARRCAYWRWMGGMRTLKRYRVSDVDAETHAPTPSEADLPDFGDPATLGCLLRLVRFALADPTLHAYCYAADASVPDSKVVWGINGMFLASEQRLFGQSSEAEALVAALELAGKQEGNDE